MTYLERLQARARSATVRYGSGVPVRPQIVSLSVFLSIVEVEFFTSLGVRLSLDAAGAALGVDGSTHAPIYASLISSWEPAIGPFVGGIVATFVRGAWHIDNPREIDRLLGARTAGVSHIIVSDREPSILADIARQSRAAA